jgi:hypothetical protein
MTNDSDLHEPLRQFYAQAGRVIELPTRRTGRPGREFLEWHLGEVLKAS